MECCLVRAFHFEAVKQVSRKKTAKFARLDVFSIRKNVFHNNKQHLRHFSNHGDVKEIMEITRKPSGRWNILKGTVPN